MTKNAIPEGDRMHIGALRKKLPEGTNILDVDIPAELENESSSGMKFLDDAVGGRGFTPSTIMLFTGTSGAGKTTLMLQMADAITGTGNVCLYNTCEESVVQVRKVTKRIKAKHGFYVGQDHKVSKVIDHAKLIMEKNRGKQLFVVCDSLQTLDDGFYANGYTNSMSAVRATEMLADFAKTKYRGVFPIVTIIGQVNKNGEFQGRNMIKHAVDIHTHLSIDMSEKSETYGMRLLKVHKNRFGYAQRCYVLDMQETGLSEVGMFDMVPKDA